MFALLLSSQVLIVSLRRLVLDGDEGPVPGGVVLVAGIRLGGMVCVAIFIRLDVCLGIDIRARAADGSGWACGKRA